MYALIDCNSFYASCEKLFRPDLKHKAVIVLSNNDGCVVARSVEAKALGIKMGVPFFKVKDFCKQQDVMVFSSNYALYADMSNRVMSTLETLCPNVEIYSIDEAFLYLADYPLAMQNLNAYGQMIKETVYKHTGIPVGVGIGHTKTLAKLANYGAKKHSATHGVCVLDKQNWIERLMHITDVGEIWGVGRRYAQRLNKLGIYTVADFAKLPSGFVGQRFGVVLERTHRELHQQSCLDMEEITNKKQIVSSRSFSSRISSKQDLEQSVCSHIAAAAVKLRGQESKCSVVTVFARNSPFNKREKFVSISGQFSFAEPIDDTRLLMQAAKSVLDSIFKENVEYAKAGVMLSGVYQECEIQRDLFSFSSQFPEAEEKSKTLMELMDKLNDKNKNTLFLASEGIAGKQFWQMQRNNLSPCYTTKLSDLLEVD